MSEFMLGAPEGRGRLAENVVHFVRVLRAAGLPLGTDRALLALKAIECAGTGSRAVFEAALRACLVDRPEHLPLFEQAFVAYWRDPDLLGRLLRLRLPEEIRIAPVGGEGLLEEREVLGSIDEAGA